MRRRRCSNGRAAGDRGQSTVELALSLPVVVLLALLLVQVGLVARAQLLVEQAARAGARAAAVDPTQEAAAAAARAALPDEGGGVVVALSRLRGAPPAARVDVRDRVVTDVPIVGSLLSDVTVSGTAIMAIEQPAS